MTHLSRQGRTFDRGVRRLGGGLPGEASSGSVAAGSGVLPQEGAERAGVAHGVAASVVVEVGVHVTSLGLPFPDRGWPTTAGRRRSRTRRTTTGHPGPCSRRYTVGRRRAEHARQSRPRHHRVGGLVPLEQGEHLLAYPEGCRNSTAVGTHHGSVPRKKSRRASSRSIPGGNWTNSTPRLSYSRSHAAVIRPTQYSGAYSPGRG